MDAVNAEQPPSYSPVFHATLKIFASIIARNDDENIAAMCDTLAWATAFRD
jgi:hypothetical protein